MNRREYYNAYRVRSAHAGCRIRKEQKRSELLRIGKYWIVMMVCAMFALGMLFPKKVNAKEDQGTYYKYYQSVTVKQGDTLWDYAKEYRHPGESMQEYIHEVEFINGLEGGRLTAGKRITIPYYSAEYICSE